jgi:hypothetical protein
MSQNVVYLHGQPSEVGHFLRIGTSGHCQELISSLAEAGAELILDTNVAELSSLGRCAGAAKAAPWADPLSVLTHPPTARPSYLEQALR